MSDYTALMNEWQIEASADGCLVNEHFVRKACSILNHNGYDLDSFSPAYLKEQTPQGRVYPSVDGFCFDANTPKELTLIVCDFSYEPELQRMRQDEFSEHFRHVKNFYLNAKRGKYASLPQSSPVYPLLQVITDSGKGFDERDGDLTFLLITNKSIQNLKHPESDPEEEVRENGCKIKRLFADFSVISSIKPPPLVLDLTTICKEKYKQGLPFLKVESGNNVDFYKSYLLVVPAEILVASYEAHKSRLLESNVRVYLQRKGKVNKGIKDTIADEPHAFFIYNNGLSVTSSSVEFSPDGTRMVKIHNPQIVNGGQTVGSLHDAVRRDKRDVTGISVQVKLTVIPELVRDVIVPYISRYSNSQNAVKDSDKRSNDFVQRALERHSRSVRRPGGAPTYWFYERLSGSYENAQLHLSKPKVNAFQATYPKSCRIKPEELAQSVMAYEMTPYLVLLGAQKCFNGYGNLKGFCDYIAIAYNHNPQFVKDAKWYKETIAKHIYYTVAKKELQKHIKNSLRYSGYSTHSRVVYVYAVSLLVYLLDTRGHSLNLEKIWKEQTIDDCTIDNLVLLADFILSRLHKYPSYDQDFKKKSVWDEIKHEALEDTGIVKAIQDGNSFYRTEKPILMTRIKTVQISNSQEEWLVFRVYHDVFWDNLDTWLNFHTNIAKPSCLAKRLNNKPLTKKQCADLLVFVNKCVNAGGPVPPKPVKPMPPLPGDSCEGNPIDTFFQDNKYDVLFLDRSCDLMGGSIFLDTLFAKMPSLEEEEITKAAEKTPELGEVRVFHTVRGKRVVLAYTRLTRNSVAYLPILEVCLQTVSNEVCDSETHLLMTHVGYEGADPRNKLNRNRIFELAKAELYSLEKFTLMSLPIAKD